MGASLGIVWGVALLVIAALSLVLVLTLRRRRTDMLTTLSPAALSEEDNVKESEPVQDTLLFYREKQGVRSTTYGHVIVRIPDSAWRTDWRDDLIRIEVNARDTGTVDLPPEWASAPVLAAYEFVAYRMTEMGTDVEIERFEDPIDLIFFEEGADLDLTLLTQTGGGWVSAPEVKIPTVEIVKMETPRGRTRVATSVAELGSVCLIRLPGADQYTD
jgi:hypothetical protein